MNEGEKRTPRDRALVEAVLAGRDGAFEALVDAYQRLVWHLIYRMVQHPEDTRELSQETFLRVYRQLAQFRFESTLATWIGRIAYHIAVRHLERRRLPLIEPEDDAPSPTEQLADDFDLAAACASDDLAAQLHVALEALPPVPRTVLTLYYLEELSVSEVAQIMAMPEGTVKNALFRARARLRAQLESTLGELQ